MTIADSTQPAPPDIQRRLTASIVIPVHNKATITRQCLDALLAEPEDGIDRQLVVVDDGSTDMTPSLLARYSDRILVIRNETALGFAGACNAGVAAAAGEFVVLLNNDTIPTSGWLSALVNHAVDHPAAAVVGAKLLFPNDTIQHAGVAIGLDSRPHHIYAGFPADHPATSVSRRFQVVTAACALFCRGPWQELGGLDTAYQNGWEDVDYCLRAGEAGYEVHYCAESVVYHFESATRNLISDAERANQELFATRWRNRITPDDYRYYWQDGLLLAQYGARYPIRLSVSPLLAGVTVGENDRLADRLLYDRARQVMILLRNNIVLNVRVQEAEARAIDAERRLAEIQMKKSATEESGSESDPTRSDGAMTANEPTSPTSPSSSDQPSSEAQPPLPHRIVGMVESPGRIPEVITDGVLTVSGWALTEAGDATIEVLINGVSRGTVPYGDPRPDAAALYPGFPAGASCGFLGEIGVGDLSDGMHESTIRISASNGAQAELTTSFEVDNHAFETGRVIGRLDQPHRGAIFIPRESIVVSGWVLAPSGIERIEAFVDGEARGRIDHRVLRPDIAKRRRQYADADHCGFSGTVPLIGLTEGSHELLVLVTANDGRQLEMPTRIEVEAAGTVDGGLPIINRHYRAWLDRRAAHDEATDEPAQLASRFSCEVIVALEDDCEDALEPIAASMRAQAHQNWSLGLVDSGSASDVTREYARHLAREDARISYHHGGENGNAAFADAVNAVIAESSADWIAILPSGIILSPNAISSVARAATANPATRLIYSDDDRIDPETLERWNPFFKPDWSPDLLLSMNYLGPLVVFHRQTVLDVGGLRAGVSGAEVYDLALRVTERSVLVHHVPEVLVTTIAAAPGSGASWHASEWLEPERQAIEDALARREVNGVVERGLHPGTWRARYALPDPPSVTAVIPTGGKLDMLRPCLDDLIERTDYPNLEILLVDNSKGEAVERLVAELSPRFPGLRRLANPIAPFNYSALVNSAIPHVTSPLVLMLNDDITTIDPRWLQAMVELAQRPEVGIVGAKLLYPDDTIQHAGVVLGPFGGSVHVFKRLPGDDPGFFDLPDVVRNVSAVTFACAVIDRNVFDEIGGLDEENLPVAFNDTDFCLRTREVGYEVLYTPHATLHHHESVTKVVIAHPHEIEFLRERWGHIIDHDPYYNPNLTRQGEDARLNMEMTSAV